MPYYYDRWGWSRNPAPKAKAGSYRRQYGTSWWGKAFLEALEEMDYSGRLGRGKTYANKGLVERLEETSAGRISASVQGSRPRPYRVSLRWQTWGEEDRRRLFLSITEDPALLGQLLAGEVPERLLELTREQEMPLFPERFDELRPDCNCPDWAVPCKHLAAVLYVLAGEIDNDPFRLFQLRGLDLAERLRERYPNAEEMGSDIPHLPALYRPVGDAPAFTWDESAFHELDFEGFRDTGIRAVRLLPAEPAFDGTGEVSRELPELYKRTARTATRLYGMETTAPAEELVPPTGEPELHLDADLSLSSLTYFNDADESLLSLTGEAAILDWFIAVEQLERRYLDPESRSLLLAFQLARKLAAAQTFLPRLVSVDAGESYLIQYLPASLDPATADRLSRIYRLLSPRSLFYVDSDDEMYEFKAEHAPEQLVSVLLGAIIRRAVSGRDAASPAGKLFLLRGRQRFDLVGTAPYPAAIHRWLERLYVSERNWRPLFRVTEREGGLAVDLLLENRKAPGKTPLDFTEWLAGYRGRPESLEVFRTLGALSAHFPEMDAYLSSGGISPMSFSVADFTPILREVLPAMQSLGLGVLLPAPLKKLLRPSLGLTAETFAGADMPSGLISLDNILRFNWRTALGEREADPETFRQLLAENEGLVRLKEGYVDLHSGEVKRLLEKLEAGPPELKLHEKMEALFTGEYLGAPVRLSPELKQRIDDWRNGPPPSLPRGLNAKLRPYQESGYAWLYNNAGFGFGSVIADDMGLGKTLQVITLLLKYREEGLLEEEKALVVVPTSLLGNWKREIERFAPDLRPHVYHGAQRVIPSIEDFDVLLTTYGLVRSEEKAWNKRKWRVLVIDEAQQIKNPAAQQTKAVKKVKAPIRIAMSGTPVENRLLDYWSLLDFTLPKYLGSRRYFNEHYGKPIQLEYDGAAIRRFKRLTAPFVLRRLKTDKRIIADLPDKVVQTEVCRLTPNQAALYQSILDENMRMVEEAGSDIGRSGLILKLITALKQCCNHPVHFLKRGTAAFAESGKALLLRDRLEEILVNGEKVLIFTQYREMGELLVTMIRDTFGLLPPFLHGGTPATERDQMVQQFQNDDRYPIFLLSIKAGGTGLNLTAANHVIHYDLWWNPAVERQATDRAYRIGQEKTVFVHRLVTEKTFEEKIDQLIQSKQKLSDLSVGAGETWIGKMSDRELRELVRLA